METRAEGATGMACWSGCAAVGTSVAGQTRAPDGCSHLHSTWRLRERRKEKEKRKTQSSHGRRLAVDDRERFPKSRVSTRHRIAGGRVPSKEVCVTLRWRKEREVRGEGVENPVGREDAAASFGEGRHRLSRPCWREKHTVGSDFGPCRPIKPCLRACCGAITGREHHTNQANQHTHWPPTDRAKPAAPTRTPDQNSACV